MGGRPTRARAAQAKAKILVVTDVEREDIDFISKTLGCLPISHVDHMRPAKLGHAALVEELSVSARAHTFHPCLFFSIWQTIWVYVARGAPPRSRAARRRQQARRAGRACASAHKAADVMVSHVVRDARDVVYARERVAAQPPRRSCCGAQTQTPPARRRAARRWARASW